MGFIPPAADDIGMSAHDVAFLVPERLTLSQDANSGGQQQLADELHTEIVPNNTSLNSHHVSN